MLSSKYKFQNFSTYLITLFFPKKRGKLFWKIYVYMRWIDDIIDNPKLKKDFKQQFLNKQKHLLKTIYSKKTPKNLKYEEQGIYDVIKLYRNNKLSNELKKHLFNMLWTFDYDIKRSGKNIEINEFMKYSKYIGSAYAFVFILFFDIKKYEQKYNKMVQELNGKNLHQLSQDYAHYCHLLHIIRDYEKDKKDNLYINVPKNISYNEFRNDLIDIVKPKFDLIDQNFFERIDNIFLKLILKRFYNRFNKIIKKKKQ